MIQLTRIMLNTKYIILVTFVSNVKREYHRKDVLGSKMLRHFLFDMSAYLCVFCYCFLHRSSLFRHFTVQGQCSAELSFLKCAKCHENVVVDVKKLHKLSVGNAFSCLKKTFEHNNTSDNNVNHSISSRHNGRERILPCICTALYYIFKYISVNLGSTFVLHRLDQQLSIDWHLDDSRVIFRESGKYRPVPIEYTW